MPPAQPIWIKICANTTAKDALAAAALGAHAVGFVFAPSKRQVTAEQVRSITASLPESPTELERVGVFADTNVETIAHIVAHARLHTVQLHGASFDPQFVEALTLRLGPQISLIHTAHWSVDPAIDSASLVLAQLAAIARACPAGTRVLVDTRIGATPSGGTGRTFDWQAARTILASQPALRIIVAGGLNPANVAEAIHLLHPAGVDVASGVELEPGRKDPGKLCNFIENAREA